VADITSDPFEVTDSTLSMDITTQPQQTTAGDTIAGYPAVTVTNGGGISGVVVTASVNKNSFAGASTVTATTDGSGTAVFNNLILNDAETDYQITFNADYSGVPNATSNAFEVTPNAPDDIVMTVEPTETEAGSIINGPPTAVLYDQYGNTISGADIDVVPNQHSFASGTTTQQTNASGQAIFDDLVINTAADNYQLFFTTTGASGNSTTFAVTNAAADSISILTQPSETVAGAAISGPPVIAVEDQYGNPVEGETITVSEEGGYSIDAGQLSLETPENGEVTFSDLVINTVDTNYQFRFSVNGVSKLSNKFNVVPGTIFSRFYGGSHSGFTMFSDNNKQLGQTPSRIEIVMQPQESVVGTAIEGPPEIAVYDATDQPVPNVSITVSGVSFGSGTTTLTTDSAGHASFNDLIIDSEGTYNLTFTTDSFPSVNTTSSDFDVIDALATMSMDVQPQQSTAGQSIAGPPTVLLENSIGMPVEGVDITVYINQYSIVSGSMTVQTDASGLAVFDDLVINEAADNYQLIFEADYSGVQNITSGSFNVIPAAANDISVLTQPGETFEGATVEGPPVAMVTDQFGNAVSGVEVSVSEILSGGIDAGITSITTDANGQASFSTLVINDNGTYQLSFSADGLTDQNTNTFQVVPGTVSNRFKGSSHSGFGNNSAQDKILGQTPVRMEVLTQPGETVAGFTLEGPPTIAVYDAVDNPVPNVQVTVNAVGGSIDAGTTTRTTNADGQISFNDLQINTPGTYQLSFTADNHTSTVNDIQTADFEVVDQVYNMQVETQPQNSTAGQAIGGAPKISIKNFINQPLAGVDVTVYINQFGFASGTRTVQTDSTGEAVFSDLVINRASKNYQLIFEADHSGISNVSSDRFDVSHAPVSNLSITKQPDETTEGAAIEGPPEVLLTDAFDNPVPDDTINVTETGGYTFDGGTTTLSSDENGLASFSDLIISTIGTYSLTFNNASAGNVTSEDFSVQSGTVSNRFKGSSHSGFSNDTTNNKLLGQTPTRIEIVTQPQETVVGMEVAGPPRIVVYDELDNTVADVDISVSVPGGFKPGSTTTMTTDSSGSITFDDLIIESTGTYQLTYSADNYPGVTALSESFDVVNQQLYLSVTTQPGETTAGQPIEGHPTVQLANAIGQGYEGVDVTVYLNQYGFASDPTTQTVTTDASGYAEFDQLVINEAAEGYQLLFDADYSGVVNVSSNAFNVVNAPVDHLTNLVDPEDTESGATIGGPPSVTAIDTFGNPVQGVTISVSETGGYTFDGGATTATTDENGIVSFDDLIISSTGQYSLTYSTTGVSDIVSSTFNVMSGTVSYRFEGSSHSGFTENTVNDKYLGQTPSRLEILAEPMETIVTNTIEGPPVVRIYDEVDNPVQGITIRVSVDGFFASGSVTEVTTDANGEAVFDNLSIDETGTYTLTFEAVGYGDVDVVNSQSFEVVDQMLNASIVTQPAESSAGSPVSGVPEVKLENDFGQGFQGVDVIAHINQYNFSSASTDTVTTDANGLATFDNLILETAGENYQIIFEIDYTGVTNITSNFFDVNAGPATQMAVLTQPGDGLAEAIIDGPPSVAVYDDYDNPVSNVDITVSEAGGYSIDGGTFTQTTDAGGTVVFDDLVINTAGTYTLDYSASAGGVSDIQSNTFDILPSNISERFNGGSHSGFISEEQNNVELKQIPQRIVILTQPEQSVASTPIQGPPYLKVYDQTDIPVQNAAVTVSLVGGSPSLSGTKTLTTDSEGEVLFNDISIAETGTYQLHFVVGGYPGVDVNSEEFEVINQTLSMSIDQHPLNTQAGDIIDGHPAVSITNEVGQPAPAGIDVVVYTNQNDFTSDPAYDTVQTDGSGIAVFDQLTIEEAADDYQLIFEAIYPGVSNIASSEFAISPAPADHMELRTQPGDGEAGSVISGPPTVGIYDVYNNPIAGIDIDVSENGGEPLTGTTTISSDANGEADFSDLIINNPGTYQLNFNANAGGVANVSSSTFNIISTGTVHRFKGGSHSGFTSSLIENKLLSEPPEVETPVFSVYEDTLCQGTLNTEYIADAANNDSIRYAISIPSAGTIDEETGMLDLQAGFYGEFYVRATAYGYQGPKTDSIKVTVEPEIDAPVFTDPVTEICQGGIATYTATSVHTDSITYSVMPAESGTMDPNTGEMNWASDFNGTSEITATAGEPGDCGGQKSTTIEVTVNPEVGTPTFIEGDTEFCQDPPNETYTATATNDTNIVYSRSPAEAGNINSSTGEMDWAADFHGTVTITARAEGHCNGPKDKELTVTIHPKPTTSAIAGEADVACNAEGEVYSVDLHPGADYAWTVPSGATITDGATGPENNSITVDFGESNGYVRVTETSQYGCVGDQQELLVTLYGCDLTADFEASETETCIGNTVTFTDLSAGNADTWEWDFGTGATPETATGAGPHDVTYSSEGTYDVTLIAKEQTVEDTITRADYITVSSQGTWLGTQNSDWFDPDNWSCGEVPDNSGPAFDVIIPQTAPNYPEVTAAGARVKNIEIENGASLTVSNDVTMNVYGNWQNDGSFITTNSTVNFRGDNSQITGNSVTSFDNLKITTGKQLIASSDSMDVQGNFIANGDFEHNNGKVSFTGTVAQNISGTADSLIFNELIVSKTNETISLQRHTDITNNLTLRAGVINSSDTSMMRIKAGASANEGNDSAYVDGPVQKTGNTAFTFPTGNNGVWAPIGISAPNLESDVFTARYYYTGHPEAGNDPCPNCGDGVKTVYDTEYWELDRTNGSANPEVTMYFKDMARSGISSISDLVYAHWNGSEWADQTIDGSAALDGNGGCYITGAGFSIYNIHAPGESESVCPNTGNIYSVPNDFDL
jgi:5-hydroxyisourate hydrolase-like protein (transthyretin family)